MLSAIRHGSQGAPIVLIHGFTQTGASWDAVAEALSKEHRVLSLHAPGHGGSSEVRAGLAGGADLMVDAAGERAAWIGYSMGGRFALHVALRRPEAVSRLVLVSTSAGIDSPEARAERRRSDEELAQRIEIEGVESFIRWWLAQPMFASLPADRRTLEERLTNSATGLASSLRLAGVGVMDALWTRLSELSMPVLVVAGGQDLTYLRHADRMAGCIGPNASLAVIEGAGHACHLERPEAFLDAVTPFLAGAG